MNRREELAWAAGFLESKQVPIRIRVINERVYPGIQITHNEYSVLERFQEIVEVGRLYGPYTRRNNTHYAYLAISYEDVQYVVAQLWNWFGENSKGASIETLNTTRRKDGRRK